MSETLLVQTARLALSKGDVRVFRNNVGEGWQGVVVAKTANTITLKNPRRVNFGLCIGSSDLIGLHSVTITADMVGKRVAVFTALEGKVLGGKTTPEQAAFIAMVKDMGGIAGVFTSVEEARKVIYG